MDERARIEYDDFAVRIGSDGRGAFTATVVHAPGGGAPRNPFEPPFGGDLLDAVLDGVARAVAAGARGRHLAAAPPAAAEPFNPEVAGAALFEALFRGDVGRCLDRSLSGRTGDQGRGLRLRLIVDPREPGCAAIAALPWELLYDPAGRGFFGLRMTTPVVRFLDVGSPHRVQPIRGPLRVLVALASPTELPPLDLDGERRGAESWGREGGVVVEVLERATLDGLRRRLRQRTYHALHFTGHGDFRAGGDRGVLFFARAGGGAEPVDGELLAALVDDCPALRLVVLNACLSGRIPRREGRDPFAGVASALVRGGVPAVVAMQFPISDRAAVRFCRDLYQSLADGDPVDAAVAEGRRGMLREAPASLEWAAPVLHLRVTDGRLFERRPAGRRRLAAAGALVLAAAGAVGVWLWLDRSGDGLREGPAYQPPHVPPSVGCPPPPSLPSMAFVRIDPGRLELPPEKGREGEGPRVLTVERAFCLGAFETTAEQFDTVMGIAGDRAGRSRDGNLPAGGTSWDDVLEFIRLLNDQVAGSPFRLPTGPEWEYAARAGSTTAYSFGDDPAALPGYGNCLSGQPEDDGFDHRPAPVGSFAPNQWGLYDMPGNLWEWVDEEPAPTMAAGSEPGGARGADGPRAAILRVRRGGSYESAPANCASGARSEARGDFEVGINGFRLARDLERQQPDGWPLESPVHGPR
jgi:formylglycine-generating enzyme required for sulfatase activity